ncbi:FHA domain-containing protein [Thermocoleostomius sinensis]|uniref:FHA domain-containing protein n=1 Tax=Thermocoleostomius sinensis A174 TaxID=2016057 RepID=A0A9E9CBS7_9CYAN|nr:FHA domain-containing protein [Thermocoleostomius sinensis]WAL61070.1 FHA domain-containing protein [Thermocoleostomius sinensis A174]
MTVCPNCNHHNPDEAVHCEACFTPLPQEMHCPSCGAMVQSDASFCGQCGFHLQDATQSNAVPLPPTVAVSPDKAPPTVPIQPPESLLENTVYSSSSTSSSSPLPSTVTAPRSSPSGEEGATVSALPPILAAPVPNLSPDLPQLPPEPIVEPDPLAAEIEMSSNSEINYSSSIPPQETGGIDTSKPSLPHEAASQPPNSPPSTVSPPTVAQAPISSAPSQTILQTQVARLLHVQTNTPVELPSNLTVVHIGKPNDRVPPDVDVSGFPSSEIVSRVHADIRIEGDSYFIEDVGSANGTYINNLPLPSGNRHRLRPGDRIALGKGDKVTFLFQLS